MDILRIYLYFWIISIMGWIIEIIVCSLPEKKFINRGFLVGPYCPIYGFGGLILSCLMSFKNNMLIVFVLSSLSCTILEYVTSYIMELMFKVRWWDYSNEFFNINGRVCLRNAIAFGFLGLITVCFINPYLFNILNQLSKNSLIIICAVVFIVTLIDILTSFNIMSNIKSAVYKINNKDATNDIKRIIKEELLKKDFLYRRFINAYNQFEYYYGEIKDKIKNNEKIQKIRLINGYRLLIFLLIGVITSFIVGYIINSYSKAFIICFSISMLINIASGRIKK